MELDCISSFIFWTQQQSGEHLELPVSFISYIQSSELAQRLSKLLFLQNKPSADWMYRVVARLSNRHYQLVLRSSHFNELCIHLRMSRESLVFSSSPHSHLKTQTFFNISPSHRLRRARRARSWKISQETANPAVLYAYTFPANFHIIELSILSNC